MKTPSTLLARTRFRLPLWAAIVVCLAATVPGSIASAAPTEQKELNFVFLHGMGATSASMQSLADAIEERAQSHISSFQLANPTIAVKIHTLQRSYPNNVDVETWSGNVADAVDRHFTGKSNLILIGHSMGGKAALYGVAHNTHGLGDLTEMVVTINSPVKALDSYHIVGGGSVTEYIRTSRVISDQGVAASLGSYDSSDDGLQVGTSKHWLALLSSESAPLSPQFDFSGLDPYPQDMDDGLVPISAQYATGADAVYYGEHGHSDFGDDPSVTVAVADQILKYVFGGTIATSVEYSRGVFEHHAGLLPFTYRWNDSLGENVGASGVISHTNGSLFKWQTWQDLVGTCSPGNRASSYRASITSFPLFTRLGRTGWANAGDPTDCALSIESRAAPKSHVVVRWKIIEYRPLAEGLKRDHYEISVTEGTPVVGITNAFWLTGELGDVRIGASSQAEGPFRWFKGEFKVYFQQNVERNVIDEIPLYPANP